ncbi:MAG: antibiotic biosynthesis monooxygenase, partial [Verrucomicrobiota bacterium]
MDPAQTVSIHPYFRVHEGKLDAFRALLPKFVEKTSSEPACHFYDFTIQNEEIIFCREAYAGAEGALAHLENVGALLEEA